MLNSLDIPISVYKQYISPNIDIFVTLYIGQGQGKLIVILEINWL